MKEEVRDICALIVILYNVRIDPCTHGAWPGHAWMAVDPHFMFVSQLQYRALAIDHHSIQFHSRTSPTRRSWTQDTSRKVSSSLTGPVMTAP